MKSLNDLIWNDEDELDPQDFGDDMNPACMVDFSCYITISKPCNPPPLAPFGNKDC